MYTYTCTCTLTHVHMYTCTCVSYTIQDVRGNTHTYVQELQKVHHCGSVTGIRSPVTNERVVNISIYVCGPCCTCTCAACLILPSFCPSQPPDCAWVVCVVPGVWPRRSPPTHAAVVQSTARVSLWLWT